MAQIDAGVVGRRARKTDGAEIRYIHQGTGDEDAGGRAGDVCGSVQAVAIGDGTALGQLYAVRVVARDGAGIGDGAEEAFQINAGASGDGAARLVGDGASTRIDADAGKAAADAAPVGEVQDHAINAVFGARNRPAGIIDQCAGEGVEINADAVEAGRGDGAMVVYGPAGENAARDLDAIATIGAGGDGAKIDDGPATGAERADSAAERDARGEARDQCPRASVADDTATGQIYAPLAAKCCVQYGAGIW